MAQALARELYGGCVQIREPAVSAAARRPACRAPAPDTCSPRAGLPVG